jgi:DUF438 domain-containing protein
MKLLPTFAPPPLASPRLLPMLPAQHLLRDLILEHEQLLLRLGELEQLAHELRDGSPTRDVAAVLARIHALADELLHAEPHHQREEKVLFPELELRGIVMPTAVMRHEHEELRALKRRLADLSIQSQPDVDTTANCAFTLVTTLRNHIHKENDVLYPMAFTMIVEPAIWTRLRTEAARFGPCCTACGCNSGR